MDSTKSGIFIIYSERLFCDGIRSMLAGEKEYYISAVAAKNEIPFEDISLSQQDIIIFEVEQSNTSAIADIAIIRAAFPGRPLLLIASEMKKGMTENIIDSGISGFIFKSGNREELLKGLSKLRANDRYFCTEISELLLNDFRELNDEDEELLTLREKQILELLVDGGTNHEIAGILRISENTVKTHRRNIMEKFGTRNLLGMIRYAFEKNLINIRPTAV